jgi:hypothetical protein
LAGALRKEEFMPEKPRINTVYRAGKFSITGAMTAHPARTRAAPHIPL